MDDPEKIFRLRKCRSCLGTTLNSLCGACFSDINANLQAVSIFVMIGINATKLVCW